MTGPNPFPTVWGGRPSNGSEPDKRRPVIALSSPDATARFAGDLAGLAEVGDLLLLTGGIGSGKTVFAQGFARGLGVAERVTSPSFVFHAFYRSGRIPLNHVDLYRVAAPEEADELGLWDFMDDAVTLVEWADRYDGVQPPYLLLNFELGRDPDDRIVTLTPQGETWSRRLGEVRLLRPDA